MSGATMAWAPFSNAIGTPNLAIRGGAAARAGGRTWHARAWGALPLRNGCAAPGWSLFEALTLITPGRAVVACFDATLSPCRAIRSSPLAFAQLGFFFSV